MPTKFFITHSHQDNPFARKLCDDLRANGLEGFFDVYSLQAGDDFAERINRGLDECDVYVPILSRAAFKSKWCVREINSAINLSNEPGRNDRPRIVSVLIEDCRDLMPPLLKSLLYVSFDRRYGEALNELLTRAFGISLSPIAPKVIVPSAPIIQTPSRTKIGKDGKEMILIPAGEFLMGSNEGEDEKPQHKIYLDAFYISKYPVTNAEYKKFVDATTQSLPEHWQNGKIPRGKENHPVVYVSWNDAETYAQWASARLPTEAEWEKAASWDDAKKQKRVYPWGNKFDAKKCNTAESGIHGTTPVEKYSPQGDSPYGVCDMAGNVWEWCSSLYKPYPYRQDDGRENPKAGSARVLRGGSWDYDQDFSRCSSRSRFYPPYRYDGVGFRVAESFS